MLSDFTPRSVIILASSPAPAELASMFRRLAAGHFPTAKVHTLLRRISLPLRLLMIIARRRAAPHNVLLRLDLDTDLTPNQRAALTRFQADAPDQLLVFQSRNIQFHNLATRPSDVAMAFINTWPAGLPRADAQRHWLERHGPLVQEVGLPPVITSYTQVHFDDSFNDDYQGLSFETITGQGDLVRCFVRDAKVRRLNRALLEDEERFTGPPLFFAFHELA